MKKKEDEKKKVSPPMARAFKECGMNARRALIHVRYVYSVRIIHRSMLPGY